MADSLQAPVSRGEFDTTDPDLARERVGQMYNYSRGQTMSPRDRARFRMRLTGGGFDHNKLRADRLEYSSTLAARVDSYDSIVVARVAGGHLRMSTGTRTLHLGTGETVCVDPLRAQELEFAAADMYLMRLDLTQTCELAGHYSGLPPERVRFELSTPITPARGRHWWRTRQYVASLLDAEAPLAHALMREQTFLTLAAATIHTFPNTALDLMEDSHTVEPGPAAPRVLRRAVAFIDANAHLPITLGEICGASRVGPRALQYAFRRHYDTTPLGYVRRVRLAHAHRELLTADPDTGDSVTTIATRWGFGNPHRFKAAYRATYGYLPGDTPRS